MKTADGKKSLKKQRAEAWRQKMIEMFNRVQYPDESDNYVQALQFFIAQRYRLVCPVKIRINAEQGDKPDARWKKIIRVAVKFTRGQERAYYILPNLGREKFADQNSKILRLESGNDICLKPLGMPDYLAYCRIILNEAGLMIWLEPYTPLLSSYNETSKQYVWEKLLHSQEYEEQFSLSYFRSWTICLFFVKEADATAGRVVLELDSRIEACAYQPPI